jgi:hypothetical protein
MKAQLIEKENVANLHFPVNQNFLTETIDKNQLLMKLNRATSLGNLEHIKSSIFFQDDEGIKVVNTTIWATAEKYILLKKGVFIPINRIIDIIT